MSQSVKLRVILEDHDIRKLTLPLGIPSTVEELASNVQDTFSLKGDFCLQYKDPDFDGQFVTLITTEDVKDKDTIKVVKMDPPVILTFTPVEELGISNSETCERQSSVDDNYSFSSVHSSGSSADTIILSTSPECVSNCRSLPWPAQFQMPYLSYDVELLLEAANEAYRKNGIPFNSPKVRSDILEKLAESIFRYTAYPTNTQILAVTEALVQKYPCLKEPGSFSGTYGWQQSLKYKMGNYRSKIRNRKAVCPELELNSLKRKRPGEAPAKGIKRPKKAEVNYLPPHPFGETEESLEMERLDLLSEVKKKHNEKNINEKMAKSFSYRRHEVVNLCAAVKEFKERWPALFSESQIKDEFMRITTVNLERTFMTNLDAHTPKLLDLLKGKGGSAGTKIRPLLDSLAKNNDLDHRRDLVIRGLISYLGENGEDLLKDYQDVNKDDLSDSYINHVLKIIVCRQSVSSEVLTDVSIVIEGTEVLADCKTVAKACTLLMGLMYALHLSYPSKLKYTFEVFQKIFLQLDTMKMSPKVVSLRNKLLS
ncbi:hypothetical protein SRHO_G00339350 [Serrasalmus rhombeus]